MRRRAQNFSKPPQNNKEMTQIHLFENISNDTKKLRKLKESGGSSCHSARNRIKESPQKISETSRTRSVSPASCTSPLTGKFPLKKFYKIYSKLVLQLETVKTLTESKRNESENLIDLKRQLQRADEFAIRFSRNNLYETKRIINEIHKIIIPYPLEKLPPSECRALSKKIILGCQAASQSLTIYINYVKNPTNIEVPEKINELILLIHDLFLSCEHLSIPPDEFFIEKDAVEICNELVKLLKTKMAIYANLNAKETDLSKKKAKPVVEDLMTMRKLSMYKTKLTNPGIRAKLEVPKRKFGLSLLGKRLKKKDERKARITHEIYTQKMNPKLGKLLASKGVKFEQSKIGDEKGDSVGDKRFPLRKSKFFTPREVKSQDDDVETMVQAIKDDEGKSFKLGPTPRETDEESENSNTFNKSSFRELLLEAIEELQNADKKEQKATLKKLLNSIQNCSKSQENTPRPPKVKVFYFKSKDLEPNNAKDDEKKEKDEIETSDDVKEKEKNDQPSIDLIALHEEKKARDEILARERRLNVIFKPIKARGPRDTVEDVVPKGKVKLKLPEEVMVGVNKYRKAFAEYRRNNIMYKKTLAKRPWELIEKISDRIILDIIEEISLDFQNDDILRKLYLSELLEVVD